MTTEREFRREDVVQLLREVEARLATRGVALDIQIVGVAAMKMAAERAKDIKDLGHIVLALRIERAEDLVRLAFDKYGEHSIALSAPANNYEIVAEEAMAAADAILLRRHNHPQQT